MTANFRRTQTSLIMVLGLAGLVASVAAFALQSGEKKAIREAQALANESVIRVKQACGNATLRFDFDWVQFHELDYTAGGLSREEALRRAGDRANRVGNALIALCADPSYKTALAKLVEVRFSPQADARNFRMEFTRQGDRMEVRFGAFGVIATQDLIAEIRKQY